MTVDAFALVRALLETTAADQVSVPRRALEALVQGEAPAAPEDRALTVHEVAARLGVSPKTVYKRARDTYRALRLEGDGRELRFSLRATEAYLARRRRLAS